MIESPWVLWLLAWAGSGVLLALLWIDQRRRSDATLVDVGWTLALGGSAVFYAVAADGHAWSRVLAGVLGWVWCVRLSWHLLKDRVLPGKGEDSRYAYLRSHWGDRQHAKFFWFYQAQALAAAALSSPYLMIARTPSSPTDAAVLPFAAAGVALFVLAMANESLADHQLAHFRANPANKGKTCRAGWWRYSRHPNYFFEWLVWIALAVAATPGPGGWWAWGAPAAMLLLVTKVSGIPWAEQQSLRSRGDDYRRYQRETSAFVPWFSRAEAG